MWGNSSGVPHLGNNHGHPILEPIWSTTSGTKSGSQSGARHLGANLGQPISGSHLWCPHLGINLLCPHQGANLVRPIWCPFWELICVAPDGATHICSEKGCPRLAPRQGAPDCLPDGESLIGSQVVRPRLDLRWVMPTCVAIYNFFMLA